MKVHYLSRHTGAHQAIQQLPEDLRRVDDAKLSESCS